MKSERIYRKRIRVSFGAVCHAVGRSSVKYSLRSVRIMHLVSGNLYALHHTCYICATLPSVRPTKRNPKCICFPSVAKRCIGGPRKSKYLSGTRFQNFARMQKRDRWKAFSSVTRYDKSSRLATDYTLSRAFSETSWKHPHNVPRYC